MYLKVAVKVTSRFKSKLEYRLPKLPLLFSLTSFLPFFFLSVFVVATDPNCSLPLYFYLYGGGPSFPFFSLLTIDIQTSLYVLGVISKT